MKAEDHLNRAREVLEIIEKHDKCQHCLAYARLWGAEFCALDKSPPGKDNMKPCEMYTNN